MKRVRLPVVGDLDLGYEVLKLAADAELTMFVYTPSRASVPSSR